ncbi:MAG: glycosyltransferase family A protein, partial [Candidatus Paceibacterota bacterium]
MQREKGFVSVIIPCYNHGAYIRDTLQSILNQTFCDYEVIIVDDGSDDQFTVEVLEEIDHPKVTVLHKENGHVSSARNYGIRHSRGEFILTLDADDQFMPEFLEKAIRVLQENSEIGSVTCYAYKFDHKGNIRKHHKYGGG